MVKKIYLKNYVRNMIRNIIIIIGVLVLAIAGYYFLTPGSTSQSAIMSDDSLPITVSLSGAYVCLQFIDVTAQKPKACVFGLKTDDGVYYMVNFGASAKAMEEFQSGQRITAKGFVVPKEALSTDQWAPYNMKGIFTITERLYNGSQKF